MAVGGASPGSLFCEHKKLKTTCLACRPAPPPEPPGVPKALQNLDDEPAPRVRVKSRALPRAKKVKSREEAERAQAWWVKKP